MRNATKEEIESIDAYINSISETMIPLSELQKIRQEIEKIPTTIKGIGYFNERDVLAYQIDVLKIIDTHISAWSGKEEQCE